ncbi:hypothetical protein PMKS-000174 [Pichia membranifaciens]|uniref:Uncharacterized protein n=1 Tax=Pichia membranifaciens TaxID=4926 RepID=A0A1Q2YB13_9ASCO|nr:hypothetical protein PMKS-000174 [Pichia membranifaciens]
MAVVQAVQERMFPSVSGQELLDEKDNHEQHREAAGDEVADAETHVSAADYTRGGNDQRLRAAKYRDRAIPWSEKL